ncbi:MAG: serine--tRNA ligase [Thermoanaerobaculia bacterium]
MLDRTVLRASPDLVAAALAARRADPTLLTRWRELDDERRAKLSALEAARQQKASLARENANRFRGGGDVRGSDPEATVIRDSIAVLAREVEAIEERLEAIALVIPNLPDASVPVGADERANRIERVIGEPAHFDFVPKAHWNLGVALGILDFERGAKLAGARFTTLVGAGARLGRALVNFMLDLHTRENGYTEIQPPFFANRDCLIGTCQLPKFEADLFKIEGTALYPVPTAEVPLTNYHRQEILAEADLPKLMTACTPCFRAEAGSHGRDVRGMIRQHQFDKVELVQITTPEESWQALERLTAHAESVLRRLALPYRVVTLSSGDMGFAAARTYDLEVWLPGQGCYREISSCSNCTDFQARRAEIRYRPAERGKPRLVHTLNGSGLAVGRTLVAILENGQQADGSVVIPEALQPYFGGVQIP